MRLTDYEALSLDCYGTLIDWEAGISAILGPSAAPSRLRPAPTTLPEAAQAIAAGNRAALAVYGGTSMGDPGLAERLSRLAVPTLVRGARATGSPTRTTAAPLRQ